MESALNAWSSVMGVPESKASLFSGLGPIPDVLSKVVESGMGSFSALQQQWVSQLQKTGEMTGTPDFSGIDKEALHVWSDLYDKEFRKFLVRRLG